MFYPWLIVRLLHSFFIRIHITICLEPVNQSLYIIIHSCLICTSSTDVSKVICSLYRIEHVTKIGLYVILLCFYLGTVL